MVQRKEGVLTGVTEESELLCGLHSFDPWYLRLELDFPTSVFFQVS